MPPADAALAPARSSLDAPWALWTGRILSGLVVLALLASGAFKLSPKPDMVAMFTGKFGYPAGVLTGLGIVEIACAVLYAIPATAVLGAVLVTGYLGGAVATHLRVGDPVLIPLILGVLAWAGLWLRDGRLRALLPLNGRRG